VRPGLVHEVDSRVLRPSDSSKFHVIPEFFFSYLSGWFSPSFEGLCFQTRSLLSIIICCVFS